MIVWHIKKNFRKGINKHTKGNYLITANYRQPWYKEDPVNEVGKFQAFLGRRSCIIELTQKEIEKWISNVVNNSKILKNKIKLLSKKDK